MTHMDFGIGLALLSLLGATLARLEAAQPSWRRQMFEATRARYQEARAAFTRRDLDGEPYYPNPALIVAAAHAMLVFTEQF